MPSQHYQNIKGIFKDHAGNLLVLDLEAQQDEITAKATQREQIAGPEPGVPTRGSPPPLQTNHRGLRALDFSSVKIVELDPLGSRIL